jgi:hypothetical protein
MWGIGKRDIKGEIYESHEDMESKVLSEINLEGRDVTITVRSRVDGSTLFKAVYLTDENPRAAHYTAEQLIEEYTKANGYYVHTKLTNVQLPYVGNANKRAR